MTTSNGPRRDAVNRRQRRTRRLVVGLLLLLSFGTLGYVLVGVATARAFVIPTNSMAPALRAGDQVLVERRHGRAPRRGEVWVFQAPPASGAGPAVFAKRIVGLPGEVVETRAGRLLVDGRPLDEPYLALPFTYSTAPVQLGPDEYWALGDDRDASNDSHAWGPVPADLLVGPVRARVWPPKRMGSP